MTVYEKKEIVRKSKSIYQESQLILYVINLLSMLLIVKFFLKEVHMYKLAIEEKNQLTKYRSNRVP